jgi:hypothetical protein
MSDFKLLGKYRDCFKITGRGHVITVAIARSQRDALPAGFQVTHVAIGDLTFNVIAQETKRYDECFSGPDPSPTTDFGVLVESSVPHDRFKPGDVVFLLGQTRA